MPLIRTDQLAPDSNGQDTLQIYNGLDCMVTLEVHQQLSKLFNEDPEIYTFERALQAPALEMMLRGFKIDQYERQKGIAQLRSTLTKLESVLQRFALGVWGKTLNPRSRVQLVDFFYGAMGLPEVYISIKGQRKLSMNREALEKLEVYFHAMPIIATILSIRDHSKQLETLLTEIDKDGRIRTSYNIAGTESGRWSSSANAFGSGGNLQNWAPSLRPILVADKGFKLVGIDLEQAEAREIGFQCGVIFGDWSYLDACEGGDLHTATAKLIWPNLKWTGNPKVDRTIADTPFYRQFSHRDMSKRGGHGTSYLGTPFTMSRHLKVPVRLMVDFQAAFFGAFPSIPRFHRWVAQQIQTIQQLTTHFGRRRHFFGRPNEEATLREAVAFMGQSPTADRMNLGLWRIWKELGTTVQLLAQVHDAVYFQVPEKSDTNSIIKRALELVSVTLTHHGRQFTVPGEAKLGYNWGSRSKDNPNGLMKWNPSLADTRTRGALLDRTM